MPRERSTESHETFRPTFEAAATLKDEKIIAKYGTKAAIINAGLVELRKKTLQEEPQAPEIPMKNGVPIGRVRR